MPDATMEEFVASGLMRLNQAERWGGPELGTAVITEVIAEVAKGDEVGGLGVRRHRQPLLAGVPLPARAAGGDVGERPERDDVVVVRGDRGIVRAGRGRVPGLGTLAVLERLGPLLVGDGRVRPAARRARRVPPARLGRHASQRLHGGRRVAHGRHAGHGLQHAGRGGRVHPRPPVPRSLADRRGHRRSGTAVNPAPMFRLPFGAAFAFDLSAPALGAAEATFEDWIGYMATKRQVLTGAEVGKQATTLIRAGELSAQLAVARSADDGHGARDR